MQLITTWSTGFWMLTQQGRAHESGSSMALSHSRQLWQGPRTCRVKQPRLQRKEGEKPALYSASVISLPEAAEAVARRTPAAGTRAPPVAQEVESMDALELAPDVVPAAAAAAGEDAEGQAAGAAVAASVVHEAGAPAADAAADLCTGLDGLVGNWGSWGGVPAT